MTDAVGKIPPPDMDVEAVFNDFVEDFGGELISKHFAGKGHTPLNADYFLRDRTVVAELKCLEKDYFSDRRVGEKVDALLNKWARAGRIRPEHFVNGQLQINSIGRDCALEVFKVFYQPVMEAVKKANKQIKETKRHFNLPDAKGLLILANDGNYSLSPELTMNILGNLLPNQFTGIDSFIYFTPNMRFASPKVDRQVHVWISGPSRPTANAIESEYLTQIQEAWASYLARIEGEEVTTFTEEDHDSLSQFKFIKDGNKS